MPNSHCNENTSFASQQQSTNPRTGKTERVFVNLQAVYPSGGEDEMSFEELRASARGWLNQDWRNQECQKRTIQDVQCEQTPTPALIPIQEALPQVQGSRDNSPGNHSENTTGLDLGQTVAFDFAHGNKNTKSTKTRIKEIKGETQTSKFSAGFKIYQS